MSLPLLPPFYRLLCMSLQPCRLLCVSLQPCPYSRPRSDHPCGISFEVFYRDACPSTWLLTMSPTTRFCRFCLIAMTGYACPSTFDACPSTLGPPANGCCSTAFSCKRPRIAPYSFQLGSSSTLSSTGYGSCDSTYGCCSTAFSCKPPGLHRTLSSSDRPQH